MTWKIASSVCLLITLSIFWVSMWQPGCPKNLLVEFSGKSYRDNKTFGRFFSGSYFFTQHLIVLTFGTLLFRDDFSYTSAVSRWFLWWETFLSLLNFVWSWDSCLEPLLVSLACFCLISPDLATCSLALHKLVFNVVVKRLSTFASLSQSTLARMFSTVFDLCDNLLQLSWPGKLPRVCVSQ